MMHVFRYCGTKVDDTDFTLGGGGAVGPLLA
jgi:hypothetical protein